MAFRRTPPSRHRAAAAPGLAAGAAAAIAAAAALLARSRRTRTVTIEEPRPPVVPGPPSQDPVADTVEAIFTCDCGQELRVRGEDRHRVYWLPDASIADPLLASVCPGCERPLPREHPGAAPEPDGSSTA